LEVLNKIKELPNTHLKAHTQESRVLRFWVAAIMRKSSYSN
jgi:hypothetical protein